MAKNCDEIAQVMKDQGCLGKKVAKEFIELRIESVDCQTIEITGQNTVFCEIRMANGFATVGKSATCIDPINWRHEVEKEISFSNNFDELCRLEGYRVMSVISEDVADLCK